LNNAVTFLKIRIIELCKGIARNYINVHY